MGRRPGCSSSKCLRTIDVAWDGVAGRIADYAIDPVGVQRCSSPLRTHRGP